MDDSNKKAIAAGIAGLVLGAGGVAVAPSDPVAKLEEAQNAHLHASGSYFSVIEYRTPDGTPGYQVMYADKDGRHSRGYGPEADSRTSFSPNSESSTSTKEK